MSVSEHLTVIRPTARWSDVHFAELFHYKDLIWLLSKRDLVALYKQTVLGPAWLVLQPLLTTAMFTVIFSKVAALSTDGVPPFLFYMSGVVVWNFFSTTLSKVSDTFVSGAGIFGKVYFPRLVVPVSMVLTSLITLGFQLVVLALVYVFFLIRDHPFGLQPTLILLPLVVAQAALLAIGLGILLSALTTKYRDLNVLLGFGLQLWMYATPVVYPLSAIPEKWHWVFMLNPMSPSLELVRLFLFGRGTLYVEHLVASLAVTAVIVFAGLLVFSRVERTSMDTI